MNRNSVGGRERWTRSEACFFQTGPHGSFFEGGLGLVASVHLTCSVFNHDTIFDRMLFWMRVSTKLLQGKKIHHSESGGEEQARFGCWLQKELSSCFEVSFVGSKKTAE